ncbi:MAG TPA: hypothetical protein VHT53_11740 [Candidatus Elarobacter sp.]|jgi:hypothetical protein|nr:hypothetical protein [Candidatus Elarobacter sp.]
MNQPMRRLAALVALLLLPCLGGTASAQSTSRDTTREQLRSVLASAGQRSDVGVTFRQSTKNPYNFVGSMTRGLSNSDSLEIVISVTQKDTIGFRVYPHYNGGYINLAKARNPSALMGKLLYLSDQNFLFWGADDTQDVFAGYTITLESGFPSDAIVVVLRSIHNTDGFVGQLRPYIDGSSPA